MKKLWKHQEAALELARRELNVALFLEIGTGKTATAINILREEYTKCRKIVNTLIFSPLSVCPQWKVEFSKWSSIPQERIHVLTGSGEKRLSTILNEIRLKRDCVVITNYESVRIKAFYEALLKFGPEILVLDESHRIKDSTTLQASKVYPLCIGARRRFILTGTPILNSMLDIFGQFRALDPSIFGVNLWKFKSLYFYDKNAGRPNCNFPDWVPRPDSEKIISEKISRVSVQAKKSECLDLPPLLKVLVPVELSTQQRKLYEDMRKHFVAELEQTQVVAEFAMTKTLRMQQIVAGFMSQNSESDPIWVKENPRIDALEDLLEGIGGKKVIIWTNFRPTYKKIGEVCERNGYRVAYLTGDESATEKQKSIELFCRGDCSALIANPSAGGAGINLQEAGYSIYYSRGYSLEHFLQSEGRNYRGGSEIHSSVTHYHLTARGTIDEAISEALLNKMDVAEAVLAYARGLKNV